MTRVLSTLVLAVACLVGVSTASANFPGDKKEGQKKEKKEGAKKPRKSPEERFKAKDKDNDGKLTLEEFVGKTKKEEAKKKLEAMFKKKDKNNDEALSLEEFKARPERKKRGKKPGKKAPKKQ